jgi:hypothetical protein
MDSEIGDTITRAVKTNKKSWFDGARWIEAVANPRVGRGGDAFEGLTSGESTAQGCAKSG